MKNLIQTALIALLLTSTLALKAQVPNLSSYPSASAVLFLDFDGQTVSNTSWNNNGPIYCAASGLNSTQITEVFNRVAEDYRPFNINITTDSTKYLAAPANKRMRMIFTISSSWYGAAGGVSFVSSFTWGDNTPAFVFTALLGYTPKYLAEAASHEAGHTLGLYHQASYSNCVLTSEYNYGDGSGEISWAPIMGVGYYKNSTTWSNGPNPYGCANSQPDLDVITSNGFGFRTDDFDETFSGASARSFTNNQFTANGMISTPADKDMFKFTLTSTQEFIIKADPTSVGSDDAGSNLDISVELFNAANTSIGLYNPPSELNVTIDTILSAGTYYMKVDGVGNNYAPAYGSLGSYLILAQQIPFAVLALRKLELHGAVISDKHQFNWIIDADEQITKQELEVSADGKMFTPVIQPDKDVRSYSYKPNVASTVQYRLAVTFNNGRQYYSNIITLHPTASSVKPQLISNLINNSISINSPANYFYTIYDFNGKTISKGQLNNGLNTVNATNLTTGMYMIHFENKTDHLTDKFIKQ